MPSSGEINSLPEIWPRGTEPTLVNKTGLWRFLTPLRKEKLSPCRWYCPLQNWIPRWMEKVKEGDWLSAWEIVREYNPFPLLTGQVCYRFCQEECHRGSYDEAIKIGDLEKEIGIKRKIYQDAQTISGTSRPEKIAVVGSGPAGMSCAFYLSAAGFQVTVWEEKEELGGLLATGIPHYRLPRELLREELSLLESMGVEFITGKRAGEDISLEALQQKYHAVLLTVGAQTSRNLGIDGENLPGVINGLELLQRINLYGEPTPGNQVAVIGGGNAAVDAASVAKRHGAREVSLIYRRGKEDMPAHQQELDAAEEAGVSMHFHWVVQGIHGNAQLESITLAPTEPSPRGKSIIVKDEGMETMKVDTLVIAVGQKTSLPDVWGAQLELEDENTAEGLGAAVLKEKEDGTGILLAAGDAITGPTTVPQAIFGGRQAARLVINRLNNTENQGANLTPAAALENDLENHEEVIRFEALNTFYYPKIDPRSTPEEEAQRCFSCGWCNECGICWVFCPDVALDREKEFEILLDYCKGCGICANECPSGAIDMGEVNRYGEDNNER